MAGCSGSADAAVLVLAAGNAVGDYPAAVLWVHGQLDGVSNQRPLRRVPHSQGEGERELQESRYPGSFLFLYLFCSFP